MISIPLSTMAWTRLSQGPISNQDLDRRPCVLHLSAPTHPINNSNRPVFVSPERLGTPASVDVSAIERRPMQLKLKNGRIARLMVFTCAGNYIPIYQIILLINFEGKRHKSSADSNPLSRCVPSTSTHSPARVIPKFFEYYWHRLRYGECSHS